MKKIFGIHINRLIRGYDSDAIIQKSKGTGMQAVSLMKNRRELRSYDYDKDPYKLRRLIENAFLVGEALQRATRKMQHLFWRLPQFDILQFG